MKKVTFPIRKIPKLNIKIYDWLINLFLTFCLIISFAIIINDTVVDTEFAMKIYGLAAIVLIIKISTTKKIVLFGPTYIILLYTIVSCFGYDILVFLNPEEMYVTISSLRHSYTEYFNLANAYYYIGVFSFVIGMGMTKLKSHTFIDKRAIKITDFSDAERKLFMNVSLAVIYFYILWLVFEIVSGRLPLTNYFEVKEYFSEQSLLMYVLRATWVAMPTYMFFANRNDLIKFFVPVSVMFIILMFTGNRNEILYPLAIAIGVYVWQRKIIHKKGVPKYVIIVSLILVFVINPMISNTRQGGFETLLEGSFGLEDALLEMGQQLNPFSIILYAFDNGIYSLQYGLTMIVPTISILSLNLFFGTEMYKTSYYNPSLVLNDLGHYGRGFSYIAEVFVNFGLIGIIIFFILLGKYCSRMETVSINKRRVLFFFQIGTLLILWSRNVLAFNFVIIIFAIAIHLLVEVLKTNSKHKLKL